MGSRGPIPRAGSHDSKRGRNTLHRKPSADKSDKVTMPAYLKGNSVAAAYWKRHAPDLIAAKRLQPQLPWPLNYRHTCTTYKADELCQ